jgi:glucose/arabinose dehydrogenase
VLIPDNFFHIIYKLKSIIFILIIFIYSSCNSKVDKKSNENITIPDGFTITVFAEECGRARHLAVNDNGDVYVALRSLKNGKGIAAFRDTDSDGKANIIKYFGDLPGTGIGIHKGYLYFGSDTSIVRYKLIPGELIPEGPPEKIVGGFELQRQHAVKPFAFDDKGWMYVNVGAPSNACMEQMRTPGSKGMDPCPLLEDYGGVWRFKAEQTGQDKQKDGYRFATGIRNAVAISWNELNSNLYVVQHGRDQLSQLWPKLFTNEQNAQLPAEEFFLVKDGMNFGWPYCYYDQLQGKKVLAPEYGGDGKSTERCENFEDPIMAFPGHWAPNDLLFYTANQFPEKYHGGAFIAFHGSWNRAPLPQQGYKVVFVPFADSLPSGKWEDFAVGFPGKEEIKSSGDAKYRPMGLAQAPDGTLYISDSVKGRIWKIRYVGN